MTSHVTQRFEKKNHHYIPQFWLRGFRDSSGRIYVKNGEKVTQASTKGVMSEDYLYTIFNRDWVPSDAIEDALMEEEKIASPVFKQFIDSKVRINESDFIIMSNFLSLAVVRTPDAMDFNWERRGEMLESFEYIDEYHGYKDFNLFLKNKFGVSILEEEYSYYKNLSKEDLLAEIQSVQNLSPQNPYAPKLLALDGKMLVAQFLSTFQMTTLHTKTAYGLVLGDHPLPDNIAGGFVVPISSNTAILATPSASSSKRVKRKWIEETDVKKINLEQLARSGIVIGSSKKQLYKL